MQSKIGCYIIAVAVITVWSTTFVSTKILLHSLSPEEIMFYRHVLAYLVLLAAYPHRHPSGGFREELLFAGAGDLWQYPLFPDGKLCPQIQHGFQRWAAPRDDAHADCHSGPFSDDRRAVQQATRRRLLYCVFGSFPRHLQRALHPKASSDRRFPCHCSGALQGILLHPRRAKIGNRYNGIYITRKIFFYAIVTMLPVLAFGDFRYDFSRLWQPTTYLNLIFLGVIASSLCFLIWSKIIWKIGPVAVE